MEEYARFEEDKVQSEEQRWRLDKWVRERVTSWLALVSEIDLLTQTVRRILDAEEYVVYTWSRGYAQVVQSGFQADSSIAKAYFRDESQLSCRITFTGEDRSESESG